MIQVGVPLANGYVRESPDEILTVMSVGSATRCHDGRDGLSAGKAGNVTEISL
ncbi:MAG: hypothetical protein J07HQW2_00488 [Haloquadratum walsbyi J07HQW2]|uniref:Uncharacterized protein n=1 Tax=Haloquadratum walsbyi J07HQW2 TaxID=1238425 RepID=U1MUM7_9EURY|nr:MAG: hypothetical protein J07HQW2_00488 [Haloquadratum walsbyi J07HQW2]